MKKRSLWGMLALLLAFGFVMAGCSTVDSLSQENIGEFTNNLALPNKDFTTLGLVFSETSYDLDEKGARGDIYTYYKLLQEVKKLNGDYMINIVIDKKVEGTFETILGRKTDKLIKGKVTWYGTATAIKYSDSIKNTVTTTVTTASNPPVTTTTTSTTYSTSSSGPAGLLGDGGGSGGIKGFFNKLFKKK
jgi:hypothetical protein